MSVELLSVDHHAPVVEVILRVQFDSLPRLTIAHLGAFWKTLGPDWLTVNDAPALDPQYERFGKEVRWGGETLQLKFQRELKNLRLQARNARNDRMIQVQNGRLHLNWLGNQGAEYPRYAAVREGFDQAWDAFRGYVARESLGDLALNQWEVTYINHVTQGGAWNAPADWQRVFRWLTPVLPIQHTPVRLESLAGQWHYEIEPQQGRLHVDLSHGTRDGREVLVLNLTARGPVVEGESGRSLDDGLRLGHDTIVKAFVDLTSDEAQEFWGMHHVER